VMSVVMGQSRNAAADIYRAKARPPTLEFARLTGKSHWDHNLSLYQPLDYNSSRRYTSAGCMR
jgi:hypothetical protein